MLYHLHWGNDHFSEFTQSYFETGKMQKRSGQSIVLVAKLNIKCEWHQLSNKVFMFLPIGFDVRLSGIYMYM